MLLRRCQAVADMWASACLLSCPCRSTPSALPRVQPALLRMCALMHMAAQPLYSVQLVELSRLPTCSPLDAVRLHSLRSGWGGGHEGGRSGG